LKLLGVTHVDMPLDSEKIWRIIKNARPVAAAE
jgi:hypothetical protein